MPVRRACGELWKRALPKPCCKDTLVPEAILNSHKDSSYSSSPKLWEYLGCCLVAAEAQSIRQLLFLWRFLPEPPPLPPQHRADACGGWGHLLLSSHGKLSFGSVLGCTCSLLGVAPSSLGLPLISKGNSFSLQKNLTRFFQTSRLIPRLCIWVYRE